MQLYGAIILAVYAMFSRLSQCHRPFKSWPIIDLRFDGRCERKHHK